MLVKLVIESLVWSNNPRFYPIIQVLQDPFMKDAFRFYSLFSLNSNQTLFSSFIRAHPNPKAARV